MSYKWFLIVKALHISFVIFWMAGMLYLPRLFVYHTKTQIGTQAYNMLCEMEKKLMRIIMLPAMVVTFITGLLLFMEYGGFKAEIWLHIKLLLALSMAGLHGFLSKCRKNFTIGVNKRSEKFYRILNEVPSILTLMIVFTVVIKNQFNN
jgi:putative membrane protein